MPDKVKELSALESATTNDYYLRKVFKEYKNLTGNEAVKLKMTYMDATRQYLYWLIEMEPDKTPRQHTARLDRNSMYCFLSGAIWHHRESLKRSPGNKYYDDMIG